MAHAPRSPGYYPAPDGNGEQWWNGVSWSESRRGSRPVPIAPIAAQTPITGQRVPSSPVTAPAPYAPQGQRPAPRPATRNRGSGSFFVVVLAALGFAFWPLAAAGVVIALIALLVGAAQRSPGRVTIAIVALVVGGIALSTHLAEVIPFVQRHLGG